MELYPGIMLQNPRGYDWPLMLRYDQFPGRWSEMVEARSNIGYKRPTAEFAAELDALVGAHRWVFQTIFASDVDTDRMVLWFQEEADALMVRLVLQC